MPPDTKEACTQLWRSCEAVAQDFQGKERPMESILSRLWRSCEARVFLGRHKKGIFSMTESLRGSCIPVCVSGGTAVFTTVEVLHSLFMQFECQEGSKEQLSPLRKSCEAVAQYFQSKGRTRNQFSPLWRPCEACACLLSDRIFSTLEVL